MDKREALKKFLDREVKEASGHLTLSAMDHLKKEEAPEHIQEMEEDFRKLFVLCREADREVRFVQIALARSRALSQKPFYLLEAFDKDFYLSEPIASLELHLEWLYEAYGRFCEEVDKQGKRYVLCFTASELDRIKLAELVTCRRMVRRLFEETLVHLLNMDEYLALGVSEGFQIQIGEYRGAYEINVETDQFTDKVGKLWYGIL